MAVLAAAAAWLFGLLLLALSAFVALETVSRKLFNFSFQGVDELGGYVLAVGGALSFSVALIERAHVRIDLLYGRFSSVGRALLNGLSALSMALLGLFFVRYGWPVISDTLSYRSTAATPWATPLIYPQAAWYGALLLFTAASLWYALRAARLLFGGQFVQLNREFQPHGALDELADELGDLARRR